MLVRQPDDRSQNASTQIGSTYPRVALVRLRGADALAERRRVQCNPPCGAPRAGLNGEITPRPRGRRSVEGRCSGARRSVPPRRALRTRRTRLTRGTLRTLRTGRTRFTQSDACLAHPTTPGSHQYADGARLLVVARRYATITRLDGCRLRGGNAPASKQTGCQHHATGERPHTHQSSRLLHNHPPSPDVEPHCSPQTTLAAPTDNGAALGNKSAVNAKPN